MLDFHFMVDCMFNVPLNSLDQMVTGPWFYKAVA